MTYYLLDTNAASAAIRGNAGIDHRLKTMPAASWSISAITYSELRYGLAVKPEALKLARLVESFMELTVIEPWNKAAADSHGRLRARLRLDGSPIGDFDEMIAAHALALNAVLVTDNMRHFQCVPGLSIENWHR